MTIDFIPHIIHVTWKSKDNVPEHWQVSIDRLNEFCKLKNFKLMFWEDKDFVPFVKKHYSEHITLFNSYKYHIQRVDVFRYFLLHHYGGIYMDLDLCIHDHETFHALYLLYKNVASVVIGESKTHGLFACLNVGICTNSFMMSVPKAKFWNNCVFNIMYNPLDSIWKKMAKNIKHPYIINSTGPGLITRAYKYYRRNATEKPIMLCPKLFTAPDMEWETKPVVKETAVLDVLKGGSWHTDLSSSLSANALKGWYYRDFIMFPLLILMAIIIIVLSVVVHKSSKVVHV